MTLPTNITAKPHIDVAHQKIHEGNHFSVHKISTGINVTTPKYFLIIPPPFVHDNVIEIHMIYSVDSDIGGTLEFFENPTVTSSGTPLAIINNNRRSATTSLTSVFEDPIVTSDGTSLFQGRGGTGGATPIGATIGEFIRDDEELILSPIATYISKFTPFANGANITMEFEWYDNRPSSPVPIA